MWIRRELFRFVVRRPRLRRFLTRIVSGSADRDIRLFGVRLRVNAVKENGYVRAERLLAGVNSLVITSEFPVLLVLASLLDDDVTFVDVGANVGLFSCTLGRRRLLRPAANRIYAYEPNPDTFVRLAASAEGLGLDLINKGVSDRAGRLDFVSGGMSNTFTAVEFSSATNVRSEVVSVECCRLDDEELIGERIVLKIDVEGQEMLVLSGARGLFESNRVIAVYIDGFDDPEVMTFLRGYGMVFHDGVTLERIDQPRFNFLAIRPLSHRDRAPN